MIVMNLCVLKFSYINANFGLSVSVFQLKVNTFYNSKIKLKFRQYMDLFGVITYSFSFLCIDGARLCVHRLGDLQGFELCVGGTFIIYHCSAKQQMLNKLLNEIMT